MADTELYDLLQVSKGASDGEIKRAYHRLVRQYHPDKNPGHEEKFKEIQFAYEVLSDSDKRELYDRFGIDAVKGDSGDTDINSFSGNMFGDSLFSHLFGGDMFGFGGGRRRRKAETIGIPLEVTLEELYSGTTKTVEYKRKILCKSCSGSGGKAGSVVRCRKCHGTGIQVSHRQIGPGMVQQMQSMCTDCGGTGDFIRERDRCKKCKGKRVLEVDHKVQVPISPGMKHDQRIPFRGEADQLPDMDAGDMIVILQQMDHATFKRADIDLFMEKKIPLQEALCGYSFTIEHLDGRKLLIKCPPGEVISPGTIRGIPEEGMPEFRNNDARGNLYIKFDVEFPENGFLDENGIKQLESFLPVKPDEPTVGEEVEEVDLVEFESTKGSEGRIREAYEDSDEEEFSGGHRVGCAHQ